MKMILINFIAVLLLIGCNNQQQGELSDDEAGEDIRIEALEKQSAADDAYANNALGDYLKYISDESNSSDSSYPTYKKSIKLLAQAIIEKKQEVNLETSKQLNDLAATRLDSKENRKSRQTLQILIQNIEELNTKTSSGFANDIEDLKSQLEEIEWAKADGSDMGEELLLFFEQSGEVLRSLESNETFKDPTEKDSTQ